LALVGVIDFNASVGSLDLFQQFLIVHQELFFI